MNAGKPRYQQLKDHIIERISSGDLLPSDRVPSEHELVEAMQVSRMTANRALRELDDEGYVERIAGRGTFVKDYRSRSHVLEVHDIAEEVRRRGQRHSSRVLKNERCRAEADVAEALHIDVGTEVFHIIVVHYESGEPIQLEDRYVLATFAPDCCNEDFATITPSAYLTSISPLQEAEQSVRASTADDKLRRQLEMQHDEACLVIIRRTWSNGVAVTFARLFHPGGRYELTGHYTPPGRDKTTSDEIITLENLRQ